MNIRLTNKIVDILKQKLPGIYAIYLYGSHASGEVHPASDVDIAFISDQKISAVQKWETQEYIAAELDADVDLVDLSNATTVLRKEVIEKGKLLFSADKYRTHSFEMYTTSMYLDLNETRKYILKDIETQYGRDPHK